MAEKRSSGVSDPGEARPRPSSDANRGGEPEAEAPLLSRILVELLGTFFTTLFAAGAPVLDAATHGGLSHVGRDAAPALVTAAMIYAFGDVSGAHLNPVVTIAFALRGVFSRRLVAFYFAGQLGGALAAAVLLRVLFPAWAPLGETHPHGLVEGLVFETVIAFLLVAVVLNTSSRHKVVGPNAAVAVGATIAASRFLAVAVSGASANPFRSSAPALVDRSFAELWIYWIAPLAGAAVAVITTRAIHGPPKREERVAAEGE